MSNGRAYVIDRQANRRTRSRRGHREGSDAERDFPSREPGGRRPVLAIALRSLASWPAICTAPRRARPTRRSRAPTSARSARALWRRGPLRLEVGRLRSLDVIRGGLVREEPILAKAFRGVLHARNVLLSR